jgi:polyhydroxyalkanoate synthesis regulator phasin
MKLIIKGTCLSAAVVAGVMSTAVLAQGAKRIVCWTDERGQRACGDVVPPHIAERERRIINERGVVVETRSRQLTAEEQRVLAEAEAASAAAAAEAEKAAAYDRFLLQTYRDEAELEEQRERRLADLQGRHALAKTSLEETRKSVEQLQTRVAELEKNGRKVPPKLADQLREFATAERDHQSAVEALERQMAELGTRYERDIQRFRELKAAAETGD